MLVVVAITYLILWKADVWRPLFVLDLLGIAFTSLLLELVLTHNDPAYPLTLDAYVLPPLVLAGLVLSATSASLIGRRNRMY